MAEAVLEVTDLTKSYSGIYALKDVSFSVKRGEIRALVGENGAGKSTLIQALVGAHRPDYRTVILEGEKVSFHSTTEANNKGISAVFQELSVVDNLSIAENIFVNRQPTKWGFVDKKKLWDMTYEALKMFDMTDIDPFTLVGTLSVAGKQMVEILKAISYHPKVLILDEPSSSLTEVEVQKLFKNLRILKEKGYAMIYISHHMQEIFELCDTVTVLKDGQKVCDLNVTDTNENDLSSKMVGREMSDIYGKRNAEISEEVMLEVKSLGRSGEFKDISFQIKKGEIVAFSGLVGAGRTEVGLCLFGAARAETGEVIVDGQPVFIKSPADAIEKGISYITEDRKKDGLFLEQSIYTNLAANKLRRYSGGLFVNDHQIKKDAESLKERFHIVAHSTGQKAGRLSGGNQQKIMIAEWFDMNPKVLIIDEPTRGVDVGAKAEIYDEIRELAKQGTAVMVISSDLMEVLGIADRIIVMNNGRISGELQGAHATEEQVLSLAISN